MPLPARLDSLRAALTESGLGQAVLSHPETLASLGCFETPVEDWPVANPFVALPALLCLGNDDAVLVCADFHLPDVRADDIETVTYRSYDFQRAPDPPGELRTTLLAALDEAGIGPGPTGVEAGHLPHAVAAWLSEAGRAPVACDAAVTTSRRVDSTRDLVAIRAACRLADVVQQTVKDLAALTGRA